MPIGAVSEKAHQPTARNRCHRHSQLDAAKIERAQKAPKAKTVTETIDRTVDLAITEHEKNRLIREARERFLASGLGLGICVLTAHARDLPRLAELRLLGREVVSA